MSRSESIPRALGSVGADSSEIAASKLQSLRRLVLMTLACEGWVALRYTPYSSAPGIYGILAAALTLVALAGWRDRFAQPALFVAFAIVAASVASTFPHNANHQFMALLLLILIALVGRDEHEFEANANGALQAARWIAAIGLGWAGLMKLYYGYWFEAEFLAHRVAHDPGFARVLGLLIPGPELARLTGLGLEVGAGPFRAAAPLLVLISNLTWIAECVLPIGFFFARTRLFSVLAAIAMMGVIQLAAREIFFGGLMLGLLLLYFEKDRVRPALPWIGLAYAAWMLRPELSLWLGSGGVT